MTGKQRLSASVDADLLEAGRSAVAAGRAGSLSAWVNHALQRQRDHDAGLQALDEFLTWFDAEYGEITDDELQKVSREMRARAIVVRGRDSRLAPPETADQETA